MKATELRIGNYFKPDALDEPHFKAITAKDIVELNDDPLDDYYQPIELTEEWLLKFGFKQIKPNHYWFKDKNSLRFSLIDNNLHCSIGDDEYGVLYKMIKYVHELQNLYYALTNQELIIQ
jgi:hypothetical protein